jgi:ERCC4-type nuclease
VFKLKIVLLLVDMEIPTTPVDASTRAGSSNPALAFVELNNICFRNEFTLLCAFSELECARYIETFKSYEAKSLTSIQEKQEVDFVSQVTKFLTSNIPGLNKSDVITLLEAYGDVATIGRQSEHDLLLIPGIGDMKAKRIYKLFNTPFAGVGVVNKKPAAVASDTAV